ncbi:hypothetical protein ACI65C_013444 [Semiaphis heraclei]
MKISTMGQIDTCQFAPIYLCQLTPNEDMIKDIIPMIGDRAKFRANLEEWRKVLALANNQVSVMPNLEYELYCEPSASSSSLSEGADAAFDVLDTRARIETDNSAVVEKRSELLNYLQSTEEGKAPLATYSKDSILDNSSRRKLCNLIFFPKEHISTYFIPYMNYGPLMKKGAKGKLLDCFNNRRREYRKAGIIAARRSPSIGHISESISLLNQTETDTTVVIYYYLKHYVHFQMTGNDKVDEEIKWLNNSSDPWNLVKNTGASPEKSISKMYSTQILKIFYIHKSEETLSLAAFLILPFLFFPITTKRKKGQPACRPSKVEVRDSFITHLRSHSEIKETITRRKVKYARLGITLQPLVIIIGPNLNSISQYFVLVDETYYVVNSIVHAVDCCLKLIHALNLQYPIECLPIWTFIQKEFYKMKTSWDTEYVSVNSLLSDLDINEIS